MKLTFNIANAINVSELDKQLLVWWNNNPEMPVIVMSNKTAWAIEPLLEFTAYKDKAVAMYRGCKVLIDESKDFGEIELR